MRIFSVGFLAGVFLLQQSSSLPSLWWLILLPLFAVAVSRYLNKFVMFGFAIAMGFAWAGIQASWQLQQPLPASLIGQDVLVTGLVSSLPERGTRKQRFEFTIEQVLAPSDAFKTQKVRLSWYRSDVQQLDVGQRWQFVLRLKPARNFANPGMFNYTGWLWQKGIRYTGYVRESEKNHVLDKSSRHAPVQWLRQSIRKTLKTHLSHLQHEPAIRALLIGDRSDLDQTTWSVLQKTGTVHLMAISGLHIGLIAGFVFVLMRRLWSCSASLCLIIAAPRAAAVAAMVAGALYAGLAGFSLPTQRALIMLSVVMLAWVFYRRTRPVDVLAVALLLVLIYDSLAVLSASFWLSFSAVALIVYLLQTKETKRGLKFWLNMQFIIGLGLLPLTMLFFQQASLISPLANLVAIPMVTFIIVPMAFVSLVVLLVSPNVGETLFAMLNGVFEFMWQCLIELSELPFSAVHIAAPSTLSFVLASVGVVIIIVPRALIPRYVAAIFFIPLFLPAQASLQTGEAVITMLDVGQGLSVVVQTANHNLVFDTGPRYSSRFDTGAAVLVPFLREQGVRRIDHLFVSHADNDHIGGVQSVLAALPVKQLTSSVPQKFSAMRSNRCEAGQSWHWDGVQFRVLHPHPGDFSTGMSENNLSCVLHISTAHRQLLLTGDIEQPAERLLLHRYGAALKSDYLVVAHHGSKTSSSRDFVKAVNPSVALLPAGWRNRYHFPHPDVVETFQHQGSALYSTAQSGAITIATASGKIETFRGQVRHYWDWQE